MKKEITVGQLLTVAVSLLLAVITAWITLEKKVSKNEIEIQQVKGDQISRDLKLEKLFDRLDQKMDRLSDDQQVIKIELQNKANRQ